jgi:transcriptional regulator with XRE-family HTH domain
MTTDGSLRVLSYNLNFCRSELGMTQNELARKARITVRSYQNIEAGKGNPTLRTVGALAEALQLTSSRLLSLDRYRLTRESVDECLTKFAHLFEDLKIGASIRTFDGVLLYRNKKFKDQFNLAEDKNGHVDLLSVLPSGAKEILRNQLSSERRGFNAPYVNFGNDAQTGERLYFRFYPCLILPPKGRDPLFSAMYMTEISQDSHSHYYQFCKTLLKC